MTDERFKGLWRRVNASLVKTGTPDLDQGTMALMAARLPLVLVVDAFLRTHNRRVGDTLTEGMQILAYGQIGRSEPECTRGFLKVMLACACLVALQDSRDPVVVDGDALTQAGAPFLAFTVMFNPAATAHYRAFLAQFCTLLATLLTDEERKGLRIDATLGPAAAVVEPPASPRSPLTFNDVVAVGFRPVPPEPRWDERLCLIMLPLLSIDAHNALINAAEVGRYLRAALHSTTTGVLLNLGADAIGDELGHQIADALAGCTGAINAGDLAEFERRRVDLVRHVCMLLSFKPSTGEAFTVDGVFLRQGATWWIALDVSSSSRIAALYRDLLREVLTYLDYVLPEHTRAHLRGFLASAKVAGSAAAGEA